MSILDVIENLLNSTDSGDDSVPWYLQNNNDDFWNSLPTEEPIVDPFYPDYYNNDDEVVWYLHLILIALAALVSIAFVIMIVVCIWACCSCGSGHSKSGRGDKVQDFTPVQVFHMEQPPPPASMNHTQGGTPVPQAAVYVGPLTAQGERTPHAQPQPQLQPTPHLTVN